MPMLDARRCSYFELRLPVVKSIACERQTFLLAHHAITAEGRFAKRPSAVMSEEKRLPFAGYEINNGLKRPL